MRVASLWPLRHASSRAPIWSRCCTRKRGILVPDCSPPGHCSGTDARPTLHPTRGRIQNFHNLWGDVPNGEHVDHEVLRKAGIWPIERPHYREDLHLRNHHFKTHLGVLMGTAICETLGSIAARQPSHSAFLWFLTMPPNQARSNIHAADPQAHAILGAGYCVLGT